MKIRIPTAQELTLLNEVTNGCDDLMHWRQICSPADSSYGTMMTQALDYLHK